MREHLIPPSSARSKASFQPSFSMATHLAKHAGSIRYQPRVHREKTSSQLSFSPAMYPAEHMGKHGTNSECTGRGAQPLAALDGNSLQGACDCSVQLTENVRTRVRLLLVRCRFCCLHALGTSLKLTESVDPRREFSLVRCQSCYTGACGTTMSSLRL